MLKSEGKVLVPVMPFETDPCRTRGIFIPSCNLIGYPIFFSHYIQEMLS